MRRLPILILAACAFGALAACGYKGPLYRPAPAAPTAAATIAPAAPASSTTPPAPSSVAQPAAPASAPADGAR